MKIPFILLVTLCLMESAQLVNGVEDAQDVGGDYGRAWLKNQNPEPVTQNNEADLFTWGGKPKGYNNTTNNASQISKDWLNTTAIMGDSNLIKSKTANETTKKIPYQISKTFNPIHELDSSFNQTVQVPELPKPDKNGLINGIPAEIYYAIGPAYFDF
jgi:hypothetical protein